MKQKIIKGFKGFNKNLVCNGFQYEEGSTFKMDGKPERCKRGFHFCIEPIDIFEYYDPANSIFHEVEGCGKSSTDENDSKIAVSKIKIGAKIKLFDLVKIGVDMILKRCQKNVNKNSGDSSAAVNSGDSSAAVNSGDSSAAVNSGNRSAAVNSGNRSAAVNSGYRSAAEVSGDNSIACGFGYKNKAKAALNCWIVLTEWTNNEEEICQIKAVKSAKIDGKRLKPNKWYKLVNNRIIEAN